MPPAMSALPIHPYTHPVPQPLVTAVDDDLAARALASARLRWGLSQRESDVLVHLAEGDANKEIAAKLSCALRTVEAHVTSILQKAGCESRAQVVAHVWRGSTRRTSP
jgi:DNA-binding NarL/FixJ family response regulator